jgi:6-pyruvoyltetrahydropterin/6-carboxytetrahydropterin synthase
VIRLTRRYQFPASHRLHSPALSEEANRALYGKCNNPHGHGHNYVLEVSVAGPVDEHGRVAGRAALDRLVEESVLADFRHANLNRDVPEFSDTVPTSENVALAIRRRLAANWRRAYPAPGPELDAVRLYETRRNVVEQ